MISSIAVLIIFVTVYEAYRLLFVTPTNVLKIFIPEAGS